MKIKRLKLHTSNLENEKSFYTNTLGFDLLIQKENLFSIKVGWSELIFEESTEGHTYHYCFLIPANKFEEALQWLEKRTDLIDLEDGRKTQRFESWNADSFYFYDGSGNVAEFIVRYDLKNFSNSKFIISDILCLNEIGMPTADVAATNSKLQHALGTKFWKGDLERFGTNGDQKGLFLLPNYNLKDTWFPTTVNIKPEPFEIEIENNGKNYIMRYKNQDIEFQ